MKHLNLFFPQWQGGGPDLSTLEGAEELKQFYFKDTQFAEIQVSKETLGTEKNQIAGYDELLTQLTAARDYLEQEKPDTLFTIGGGCDADLTSIAYMNQKLEGNLTVLCFDAHGDLNTPQSSGSGYFYGMPLRTLLGEGDEAILKLIDRSLQPQQLILTGMRDLDQEEREYIVNHQVSEISAEQLEEEIEVLLQEIRTKGHQNLYIHIDLDVLDPADFPHTPLPTPGGIKADTLAKVLSSLKEECSIAGMGLFEYQPSGMEHIQLLNQITDLGKALKD